MTKPSVSPGCSRGRLPGIIRLHYKRVATLLITGITKWVIDPFRFIVRNAFTLDERGTVASGYIESGTVRVCQWPTGSAPRRTAELPGDGQ
jgi:hypothetical protein